jgi:hypothetical protein
VAPTASGDTLVQAILGPGVSYSNVVYQGASQSGGTFAGAGSAIGIDSGILLTSGSVGNAVGPNTTSSASTSNGSPGDSQLNALSGGTTFDATTLSFDFTTTTGDLFFSYVFASEEYLEYVNTGFNDVFGFFVDGVNIALLPGTGTPVSINNVNLGQNPASFIDNTSGVKNTQYDGLTTVLTAAALGLRAGTHSIKLAIADVGDTVYDSGVFIKAGSFSSTAPPSSDVPELDASSAGSALMLLLVGGLMIAGRKRQQALTLA